jgi:hypothetical protein
VEPHFNRETIFENLVQEENLESSWLDRSLGIQKSRIYTTAELGREYFKSLPKEKANKVFKVPRLLYILYGAFVLFLIGMMLMALFRWNAGKELNVGIALIPGGLILIVMIVLKDFNDENQNFSIILSRDSMTIRNIQYNWDEILDTFIIVSRTGRATSYFLIVALNAGTTDRWDVTNLLAFTTYKKLAAYIEHYKKIA